MYTAQFTFVFLLYIFHLYRTLNVTMILNCIYLLVHVFFHFAVWRYHILLLCCISEAPQENGNDESSSPNEFQKGKTPLDISIVTRISWGINYYKITVVIATLMGWCSLPNRRRTMYNFWMAGLVFTIQQKANNVQLLNGWFSVHYPTEGEQCTTSEWLV